MESYRATTRRLSPATTPPPPRAGADHPGSARRVRAPGAPGPTRRGDPVRHEAQGGPAAAAEAEDPDHLGDDAGLDRRLRADLGLAVRGRLRAPAADPRDGSRDPAPPRGCQAPRRRCSSRSSGPWSPRSRWARTRGPRRGSGSRVPCWATLGTLIPLGIWLATGNEFWQALAYVGFFINLFNLLPVLPLDGGRAMAALSPWVWFVGYARTDRADDRLPEPDPLPGPRLRGPRELAALQAAQDTREPRLPRDPGRTRTLSRSSTSGSPPRSRSAVETFLARGFGDV